MSTALEIFHEFSFSAAHRLPHVPPGHKCASLHGHTYAVVITITGTPHEETGWIMDFADLKAHVEPIIDVLDHSYLNEVPGLANPTSERLAEWLWEHINPQSQGLTAITVRESDRTGCTIRKADEGTVEP